MTATIMDGRALAAQVMEDLRVRVQSMKGQGARPVLATVLVGDNPASILYVAAKHKAALDVGITPESHELGADTEPGVLSRLMRDLSASSRVNGILLQLPLPFHIDYRTMVELIAPEKDVDGLTAASLGGLVSGRPLFVPATPLGVMALLHHYGIRVGGANATIINRSILVGKPLCQLLLSEDATVTMCHSKSGGIVDHASRADILVTAVGRRPDFVLTADMVKEGATVIDVGTNKVNGKTVGDVDFEAVCQKASFVTPVPGGVGPMTIAMLLRNTVTAAATQLASKDPTSHSG